MLHGKKRMNETQGQPQTTENTSNTLQMFRSQKKTKKKPKNTIQAPLGGRGGDYLITPGESGKKEITNCLS